MLLRKGDNAIGAMQYPDRKRPSVVFVQGNQATVFGTFSNEEAANEFVEKMMVFFGCNVFTKMGGGNEND